MIPSDSDEAARQSDGREHDRRIDAREHRVSKRDFLAVAVETSEDAIIGMTPGAERITHWNLGAQRLYGWSADEMIGQSFSRLVPEDKRAEYESTRADLVALALPSVHLETVRLRKDGSRVDVSVRVSVVRDPATGERLGLCATARDITGRKRRESHEQFLKTLTDQTRRLTDPDAIVRETVRATGEFLDLLRFEYVDICDSDAGTDAGTGTLTVRPEWVWGAKLAGAVGTWPLSNWNVAILADLRGGKIVTVTDARTDPRTADNYDRLYAPHGTLASVRLPILRGTELVGALSAQAGMPRDWQPDDLQLLVAVAERMWGALESARLLRDLHASEDRLRDVRVRMETALAAGGTATWTIDLASDSVTGDAYLARLFSMEPEVVTGDGVPVSAFLERIYPGDRPRVRQAIERALSGVTEFAVEYRVVSPNNSTLWIASQGRVGRDADGGPVWMYGTLIDITVRKEAQEAIQRLAAVVKNSTDFIGIALLDGTGLFVNDAGLRFVGLDETEDVSRQKILDYIHPDDRDFIRKEFLPQVLRNGYGAIEVRFRHFQTGEPIWVHYTVFTVPDSDTGEPMALATVTRDVSGQKAAAREQERLLSDVQALEKQARERAEREALLNEIGEVARTTPDPHDLQSAAVAHLGAGMGADRCYFVSYYGGKDGDSSASRRGRVTEGCDWYQADLPPIKDVFDVDGAMFGAELFRLGATLAIDDLTTYALNPKLSQALDGFALRSFVAVPFFDLGRDSDEFDGSLVAALILGMADDPRHWTPSEISLIEASAALARSAAGAAQVQQRERNIALQLQSALTPELPEAIPGMKIASFYKPALDEASVGGDFLDLFSLGPDRSALIVGDVSGKGLAAAQQVATVRNMLRYALYSTRTTWAQAMTELNRVLAENELMAGFATLFCGIYDGSDRTLTYINCGQESGLVWLAETGTILELPPTGSVLGSFMTDEFTESTLSLSPGDVIALFTDGLTEVGPNRREQLEIAGVSRIFHESCAAACKGESDPKAVRSRLISEIDRFARGGRRDDIALLIGCVAGVG